MGGRDLIGFAFDSSDALVPGSVSASTSAAAFPAQAVREVLVQNDPANVVDIFIGNAALQPIRLQPGQNITLRVSNLSVVYHRAASGTPTVNYLAR